MFAQESSAALNDSCNAYMLNTLDHATHAPLSGLFMQQVTPRLICVYVQIEKGWTDAALIAGAQHIGLSPAAIGLLPRGPAELVEASLHSFS